MAKKRKKDDGFTIWHFLAALVAAVIGFAKGFSDGMKPPPGDRRG